MADRCKQALIVDDEPSIRALTAVILQEAGYDVAEAGDGAAAIEYLKSERPDVVVLDILMPNVDGWGVIEFLRTLASQPPVVVVSGMDEVIPPGQLAQYVTGYVRKPFAVDQLLKACDLACSRPPTIPATGMRKEARRTFVVETTLLSATGRPLAMGHLREVSRGGFRIEISIPIKTGDPVRVAFKLPGRERPVELSGRVRWRDNEVLGADIETVSEEDSRVLRDLLDG